MHTGWVHACIAQGRIIYHQWDALFLAAHLANEAGKLHICRTVLRASGNLRTMGVVFLLTPSPAGPAARSGFGEPGFAGLDFAIRACRQLFSWCLHLARRRCKANANFSFLPLSLVLTTARQLMTQQKWVQSQVCSNLHSKWECSPFISLALPPNMKIMGIWGTLHAAS